MGSIVSILLLLNFWHGNVGVRASDTTITSSVLIIGTVHRGNPLITSKSLLRVIEIEKPDIIFIEADTVKNVNCKNKNVFGLEIAAKLGIWKPSIEQRAVQRYVKKNNEVCIIPYDTLFERRAYIKNFVSHTNGIYNKLDSLFEIGYMTERDVERYGRYQNLSSFFYSQIEKKDLKGINGQQIIDSSRLMMHMKDMILPELAATYIPNEREWLIENLSFDNNRNQFMGRYLLKSLAQIKSRKIIVLTGLLHKYYLTDYLSPFQKEYQFILTTLR